MTWAFLFEGQPYFDGFRDLATNGIDKPVVGIFRMLGMMSGDRVAAESSGGLPLDDVRDRGVRAQADVNALATRDAHSVSVLVWNYHDDDLAPFGEAQGAPSNSRGAAAATVSLQIRGLPGGRPTLTEYRVDTDHSNAYTAWKTMGSPQSPTAAQYSELERAGQLQTMDAPKRVTVANGQVVVTLSLPRQGVSLVRLTW